VLEDELWSRFNERSLSEIKWKFDRVEWTLGAVHEATMEFE
jgi:hypothetical protein